MMVGGGGDGGWWGGVRVVGGELGGQIRSGRWWKGFSKEIGGVRVFQFFYKIHPFSFFFTLFRISITFIFF